MNKRKTCAEFIESDRQNHMRDVEDIASLQCFSPSDIRALDLCQVFHWSRKGFVSPPHYEPLRIAQ